MIQAETKLKKTPVLRIRKPSSWRLWQEQGGLVLLRSLAIAICLLLVIISLTLLLRGWPLLQNMRPGDLLLSAQWHPLRGQFGLAPVIGGTLLVTLIALLIAGPGAILSAVYLSEYTNPRTRMLFKPVVDLLAGIPPVVYGLWGVLVVVPLVREQVAPWLSEYLGALLPIFANVNPTGYGLFTAGFVLAMMIYPIIVSVGEEVLRSVPEELRLALYSVGATKWEVTRVLIFRAARGGLLAAVVLGLSRAVGETLAVLMLVGNVVQWPRSLFDSTYTLASLIANTYGELMSVPLFESALMIAAFVLLLLVVAINIAARLVLDRQIQRGRQ